MCTYMLQTQRVYQEFCRTLRAQYSDDFWRVFSAVHLEPQTVIDKVLNVCRSTFVPNRRDHRNFALSVRDLRRRTLSTAGDFASCVIHAVTVDLSEFSLPGIKEVQFRFVNPLWGCIVPP